VFEHPFAAFQPKVTLVSFTIATDPWVQSAAYLVDRCIIAPNLANWLGHWSFVL